MKVLVPLDNLLHISPSKLGKVHTGDVLSTTLYKIHQNFHSTSNWFLFREQPIIQTQQPVSLLLSLTGKTLKITELEIDNDFSLGSDDNDPPCLHSLAPGANYRLTA